MNALKSQKHLLIAESELNRAQFADDVRSLKAGVRTLTGRATSWEPIASSAAVVAIGLAAFPRGQSVGANAKPSLSRTVLTGAVLIATLWLGFRAQSRHGSD